MNGAAPKAAVWGGLKLNGTPLWGENGSKIQDYTGSGKPYAELKLNANEKDPTKFDDPVNSRCSVPVFCYGCECVWYQCVLTRMFLSLKFQLLGL